MHLQTVNYDQMLTNYYVSIDHVNMETKKGANCVFISRSFFIISSPIPS